MTPVSGSNIVMISKIHTANLFNMIIICNMKDMHTVTPFKLAAIKVRGFEIMTYSRLFNFAVSYQIYFTVSYTNVVFSYTN